MLLLLLIFDDDESRLEAYGAVQIEWMVTMQSIGLLKCYG